jgi:hypothetical protein
MQDRSISAVMVGPELQVPARATDERLKKEKITRPRIKRFPIRLLTLGRFWIENNEDVSDRTKTVLLKFRTYIIHAIVVV